MKVIRITVVMILLVGVADAGENFTISGEVYFQYDGDIYLCLDTVEKFTKNYSTRDYSSTGCQITKMNADLKKAGRAAFKFTNVPKETYGIMGFQDVIGNGKLDTESLLISETFGSIRNKALNKLLSVGKK